MVRLFKKVPQSELQVQYPLPRGYLRIFQSWDSASFFLLVEQLAIEYKIMMLQALYFHIEKMQHNNQPMALYYRRYCIFHLKDLVGKLYGGLSVHIALQLFYRKAIQSIAAFDFVFSTYLKPEIFQKAGYKLTTLAKNRNYQPLSNGVNGKELVLIQFKKCLYGNLVQDGEINFQDIEKPILLKACSSCNIAKEHLANNIFCSHRYCVPCMKVYFYGSGVFRCPIKGCYAKVIGRLLSIKQLGGRSRAMSERQIVMAPPVIKLASVWDKLMDIEPDWPPKFSGAHIPGYIEEQFIQMRNILDQTTKLLHRPKTVQEMITHREFCGSCYATVEQQLGSHPCGKHPLCLKCCMRPSGNSCKVCEQALQ